MPITLGELAPKLNATLASGDPARRIEGVSSLADGDERHIAPFTDARYLPQLKQTRAGAVLAQDQAVAKDLPSGTALLCTADPELALVTALQLLYPEPEERPEVHPSAVVEAGAELGTGVHVGPYAVIRAGARIGGRSWIMAHAVVGRRCVLGEDCRLYPHVVLYDGVMLGRRVSVHAGSVLGADGFGYKFRQGRYVKVPQISTVEIGDDVEIGANTAIDRGALSPTRVGAGTKIDNLVQLGHGVTVGRHCILCGQAAVAGSARIEDYAVVGGNAGVADHVCIGKGARIGAMSGIGTDIAPGKEVFGPWAQERRKAFREIAAVRRLPELFERVRELERRLDKESPEAK
ncbi:MAG: UDP-3-O-(3-hydroxymyristoyl)glucosamine N-acyltransferase [Planctomycetota bacterium]|nr:UDP-3-O-(3-hydroxymyristoyl)glucosamine N-acyltransferase [Planctomycetota bacterium]